MLLRKLNSPGKTPANPSAFSMSSSTGKEAIDSSLLCPRSEEEGYMFVPIPSLRPVSFPIANWSPVIILTLTPRFSALRIVSALSCLGGSKRGNRPTNCHGPPALSLVFSGTVCRQTASERRPRSANLSMIEWAFFLISSRRSQSSIICSGAPLLTRCQLPSLSIYVIAVRLSTGLKGKKWTSLMPSLACKV